MIKSLTQLREESEDGFTLIELLVVILIIGILAGIAIPSFLNQRKGAVDAAVQRDITNVGQTLSMAAMEGSRINSVTSIDDKGNITDESAMASSFMMRTSSNADLADIKLSSGTTVVIQPSSVDGAICIFAVNPGGNQAAKAPGFVYDSNAGGLLREGLSPSACADEAGELNIPTPAIERALKDETSTGPGEIPSDTVTSSHSGLIFDQGTYCYKPNTQYNFQASFTDETVSWSVTGLEDFEFEFFSLTFQTETGKTITSPEYGNNERSGQFENTRGDKNLTFNHMNSNGAMAGTFDFVSFGYEGAPDTLCGENGNEGTEPPSEELPPAGEGAYGDPAYSTETQSLYDRDRNCMLANGTYTVTAKHDGGYIHWAIEGLDDYTIEEKTLVFTDGRNPYVYVYGSGRSGKERSDVSSNTNMVFNASYSDIMIDGVQYIGSEKGYLQDNVPTCD